MPEAQSVLKTIYIESYSTNEYVDAPNFGKLDLTESLVEKIKSIHRLIEEHNLSEVRTFSKLVEWDDSSEAIANDELVVTQVGFWFQASIGRGVNHIETRIQCLDTILLQLDDHSVTYYGEDMRQDEFNDLLESRRNDAEIRVMP